MKISERIEGTIENWRVKWGELLKGWMSSWLSFGIELLLDILGKAFAPILKPLVQRLRTTDLPEELKPLLDEIENPRGEVAALLGYSAASAGTGGIISSTLGPILLKYCQYPIQSAIRQYLPPEAQLIVALWRGVLTRDEVNENLKKLGYEDGWIDKVENIYKFLPSPGDIVNWYAKEVYEPDMIERYGLESELPEYEKTDFPKVGVDATQARNYWMAHWEHASYMQIREMIHRGVLSLGKEMPTPPTTKAGWEARDAEGVEAAYDWYRLVEIPPFWRDRLTEMMFEVPTRVDVRRWWDMRTIDEERLRSIYHSQGYHGKDLDDYVLWTKVYVAFPDLVARWKNGWITEDDVRSELTALGMPYERVNEMIQTKIKPSAPGRVEGERELTKTDIIKGVKKEVISWDEGIELLADMGYSEDEADYLLKINIEALAGSPETFFEFKDITQRYRRAVGMPAKPVSEELKKAAAEVVSLTKDVEALERSLAEEEHGIIETEGLPEAATKKRDELRVSLHRAEAKLSASRAQYNSLVAEWKHGG